MPRAYILTSLVLVLTSCDLFDKEETIPGFVHISFADLVTVENDEGAASHGIFDVHVFADEDFVGSFELPATIPILKNGPTTLNISAGIKNNGVLTQRIVYPFYAPLVVEKDLIPGGVLNVRADSTAVFGYFPDAYNIFFEGFEGVGNALITTDNSDTDITVQDTEVRSGILSGRITLTAEAPRFEALSNWELGGIPLGRISYLEIDFKGNNPLEIGVRRGGSNPQKVFIIGLNPQEEWTKLYIEVTATLGNNVGLNDFEFYFESQLRPGTAQAEIFIDNIRYLYPKN